MKTLAFLLIPISALALHFFSATPTAFQLAQIEDKMVIYVFESKTCGYCYLLNEKTFKDPMVRKILDVNYKVVVFYAQNNPGIFDRFGVTGTPTLFFFESSGKPVAYLPGFVPPDVMVKVLAYVWERPKVPFREYYEKFKGYEPERKLIRVSGEEAKYVLKNDPEAVLYKNEEDYKGETFTYVVKDEKVAKELLEKAYRVLLVKE